MHVFSLVLKILHTRGSRQRVFDPVQALLPRGPARRPTPLARFREPATLLEALARQGSVWVQSRQRQTTCIARTVHRVVRIVDLVVSPVCSGTKSIAHSGYEIVNVVDIAICSWNDAC